MFTINLLSKINKSFIKRLLKKSSQKDFYLYFALNNQEKENFLEVITGRIPILSIAPVWQWPGTVMMTRTGSPNWGIKIPVIDSEIPTISSFIGNKLLNHFVGQGDFAILDKRCYPWFVAIVHEYDSYFYSDDADSNKTIPFLQENHLRFWIRNSISEEDYKPY